MTSVSNLDKIRYKRTWWNRSYTYVCMNLKKKKRNAKNSLSKMTCFISSSLLIFSNPTIFRLCSRGHSCHETAPPTGWSEKLYSDHALAPMFTVYNLLLVLKVNCTPWTLAQQPGRSIVYTMCDVQYIYLHHNVSIWVSQSALLPMWDSNSSTANKGCPKIQILHFLLTF